MQNFLEELQNAVDFVHATWRSVVMGTTSPPPGTPLLRFDTIDQRSRYANSIVLGTALDVPESGQFERKIIATAKIAEMTEHGYAPFDMKPMLLNGPKARISKKGTVFNIIPFRHGVPGKSGDNAHFKNMPQNIYEAARQLKSSVSVAGTPRLKNHGLLYGGKLNSKEHGDILGDPKRHVFGHVSDSTLDHAYRHKKSIYDGMVKVTSGYGKTSQSKYLTFRVVSEKSAPYSWWHPGRPPQPHLGFIIGYCQPKIERGLKEAAQRDFLVLQGVGMEVRVD
jgi:hypothetical protein